MGVLPPIRTITAAEPEKRPHDAEAQPDEDEEDGRGQGRKVGDAGIVVDGVAADKHIFLG